MTQKKRGHFKEPSYDLFNIKKEDLLPRSPLNKFMEQHFLFYIYNPHLVDKGKELPKGHCSSCHCLMNYDYSNKSSG